MSPPAQAPPDSGAQQEDRFCRRRSAHRGATAVRGSGRSPSVAERPVIRRGTTAAPPAEPFQRAEISARSTPDLGKGWKWRSR